MKTAPSSALTILELLVVLVVLFVLAALALPYIEAEPHHPVMIQTLSNMKQLHLIAEQMALDGVTTGDTNLAWPGDLGGSFANWVGQAVPVYLTTNDFDKLLSVPGKIIRPGSLSFANTNGILMYAVSSNSPATAVIFTSANFTNTPGGGLRLDSKAVPYGTKGFVVFRKGGDGAIRLARQAGDTNVVGTFAPLCH